MDITGIGADGPDYINDNNAISVGGRGMSSHVKVYNNTIYNTGDNLGATGIKGVLYIPDSEHWGGTIEWFNNIVYDTYNIPFSVVDSTSASTITAKGNNLWYSSTGNLSTPTWDTAPISTNPSLGADYTPSAGSPVINAGSPSGSTDDLRGAVRYGAFDIGAFEYIPPGKRYRYRSIMQQN